MISLLLLLYIIIFILTCISKIGFRVKAWGGELAEVPHPPCRNVAKSKSAKKIACFKDYLRQEAEPHAGEIECLWAAAARGVQEVEPQAGHTLLP